MSWEVPAGGIGSAGFTNTGLGYDGANLLIGDFTNSRIVKATPAGAYVGEVILASAPANSVQGVAWDTSRSHYWVCHYAAGGGSVRRYDGSGALQQTISFSGAGVDGPNGCAYDATNDRVITIWDDGRMRSYACATGTIAENVVLDAALGTGSGSGPDGVTLDPDDPAGYIWVSADTTPTRVHKINRSTGASVASWVCPVSPEGMVWGGSTIYLCCDASYHASVSNGNRVYLFNAAGRELQGAAFLSKLVQVDLSTSAGAQRISGVGFRPSVIIALGGPTVAAQATAQMCMGAADSQGRQWALATRWNDSDSATPVMAHEWQTNRVICRVDSSGGAFLDAAYLDAFHDGFRVNVTQSAGANVHRCAFLCLAGDDFDGAVGSIGVNNSTGVQTVAGLGFQPSAVILATNKSNTTAGRDSSANARFSLGVMTAAAQWAIDTMGAQASPSAVFGSSATDAAFVRTGSTSTYSIKASRSSLDADGFSINVNPAAGAVVSLGYIALSGVSAKAGTFNQRTSTGTQAVTGVGFQPKAVLFASAGSATSGPQAQTRPSYGVATATAQSGFGNSLTDGSGPLVAGREMSETAALLQVSGTGSTRLAAAAVTAMDVDGFTLNWTTADAVARQQFYLALADASATPPTLAGSIAVTDLTTTSYTITSPVATDNVGVAGYQYRLNAGSWVDIPFGGRVASITGRTPGSTDAVEMRAYDSVPNYSTALSASINLPASDISGSVAGTGIVIGTGAVSGTISSPAPGSITGSAAGLGVVIGVGAVSGSVETPGFVAVTAAQVTEYLDAALSMAVPGFVVSAAVSKVTAQGAGLLAAGYSEGDRLLIQCYAAALVAAAGTPRRLQSQSAPSGASRSFKTGDRALTELRRSLTALDTAGVMAQVVGPDPAGSTMFMVV